MVDVSIIVAAYNIENEIERSLNSIINQTYENIEVIVVNDGSTDKTLEKINSVLLNQMRIKYKIINKKNEGLIEARKSGFKKAQGEYVLFMDGDDYIDKNTIDYLYRKAKCGQYDIVQYNYVLFYDDRTQKNGWDYKYFDEVQKWEDYKFLEKLLLGRINQNIWSKFIRREFIIENNIKFPEDICYGEDLALSFALAVKSPKVLSVNKQYYYYYQREGSLSNKVNEKILEMDYVIKFIEQQLKNNNLYLKYKNEYNYFVYSSMYYSRIESIFIDDTELNRLIFNMWKNKNICINCKNKYYKDLIYKDNIWIKNFIRRICYFLCKRSYKFSLFYFKKHLNLNKYAI